MKRIPWPPRMLEASDQFYARLFAIAPELRALFRADLGGQGMRFMGALGAILEHIDNPGMLRPYLRLLAEGHAAYGVEPDHFRPMGQALVETMREVLGAGPGGGLSAEAEQAWRLAYDSIAAEMVALARE